MRRLLAAGPLAFFAPTERVQKPTVVRTHIAVDGREVARAVHRHAREAK